MKRFSDTSRMDEEWYFALPLEMKAAFELLWAKADAAGVWTVNHRLAEFQIGKKVNWPAFIEKCGGRIVVLDQCRYFLREFVRVNCGRLSRDCRAHTHVFTALEKHQIDPETILSDSYPDSYPVATAKDKEQEPEKEEDKEPDKDKDRPKAMDRGTVEEIREFCTSEKIPDADWFFHKCEGNGWQNNGKPIRDWKATLRAWKSAGYLPSQKVGYKPPSTTFPLTNAGPKGWNPMTDAAPK